MATSKLNQLNDIYITSIKDYLSEIDRPNSVIANYFKSMIQSIGESATEKEIFNESHNYAWDLSSWLNYPYPFKLFHVYHFYIQYFKLSKQERLVVRKPLNY